MTYQDIPQEGISHGHKDKGIDKGRHKRNNPDMETYRGRGQSISED